MSTQSSQSILFTHTTPQQGFKLLELPPELVDLVSSKDAPTLELKSLPPQTQSQSQSTRIDGAPEYVNLCTPTRTYRVRQAHSSNSLHVIRPGGSCRDVKLDDITGGRKRRQQDQQGGQQEEGQEEDGGGDDNDGMDANMNLVDTMMTSIAKCGSTLELHTPPEGFSAVPFLMKMLRVYDSLEQGVDVNVDVDVDMTDGNDDNNNNNNNSGNAITTLFADIPISKAQCEQGWVELCAFVHGRPSPGPSSRTSCCWRPSSNVKVDVWKRVVEGAVLHGIDLEKQFLVNDLWKSVLDDDDDDDDHGGEPFPKTLFEAVVRRVCEVDGVNGRWMNIDKPRCIKWVGETYLEAMAPTSLSAIGRSEFLNAWKDHLPESWRNEVAFSKLPEGSYEHPDPTAICFVNEGDRQKLKKNISTDASAATTAKKSRNWHELFKNKRR